MATSMTSGYVSADGHVVEPADLWVTRMDKRFRDRAPRVESRPDADYPVIEGVPAFPIGVDGAMINDKAAGKIERFLGYRYGDTRAGAWDPQARLADQDLDGVRAEVIYPGAFGMQFYAASDAEYQRECFRVYNNWLSEFCSVAPKRLLGVGFLPMRGPLEWTIEEANRVARMGLPSIGIPSAVPEQPYSRSEYEPLWATLQDLGLPVALHIGTGTTLGDTLGRMSPGVALVDNKIGMAMRAVAELIWAAIPQRYPKLQFIIVEGGIGWCAAVVRLMDHWWEDHYRWMEPKLDEKPSFYFHRQFWATFEDDRAGLLTRELLNIDRLLWGSDYPHTEGTFPRSREQIARDFAGVPEAEVHKMVVDNAARLYGLTQ